MFDEKGDRKGLTQIEQLQGREEVKVGVYDPSLDEYNKIRWDTMTLVQWQGTLMFVSGVIGATILKGKTCPNEMNSIRWCAPRGNCTETNYPNPAWQSGSRFARRMFKSRQRHLFDA